MRQIPRSFTVIYTVWFFGIILSNSSYLKIEYRLCRY